MNICTKCILPESYPGILFDENGVCNFCQSYKGEENLAELKTKYRKKFENLLKSQKERGSYDVLMAFSGGKDSSYTMYLLKEKYNLKILAFSFDNGFISPRATENINNVVEALKIDLTIFKPRFDILKNIFAEGARNSIFSQKTLDRASTICTSCIGLVKAGALRLAIDNHIPFIAFGWSPGQAPVNSSVFKNNPKITKLMQKALLEPLQKAAQNDIAHYFLEERHYLAADLFPTNISPLAFLPYNEDQIEKKINQLGWKRPEDTDFNSSNCLLNSLGIHVHKEKYNFHPYASEIANMVREGVFEREEGIKKIYTAENQNLVCSIKKRLEL